MANTRRFRIPVLALAIAGVLGLTGYAVNSSGNITWRYFTGSAATGSTTATPYTSTGLPNHNDFALNSYAGTALVSNLLAPNLASDFISRIALTLPEGKNINTAGKVPGGLAGDDQTNVRFKTLAEGGVDAEVWVTFLNETAGFANSVGFFTYDPKNPPTSRAAITNEQIILPNVSVQTPLQTATTQGSTIYLGKIPAGKALGFFVVSNGWSGGGRVSPADGKTKVPGVNESVDKNWIFYSIKGVNSETSTDSTKNQHTILLDDTTLTDSDNKQYERLVLGFEDYLRVPYTVGTNSYVSDHDFNDVIMAVHVSPPSAIANLDKFPKLIQSATDPDADGDGVKDSLDEFPNDPTASSSRWPLGSSTWGTLAYEDTWPAKGDYDLNDMVMRYRSREVLNAGGKVSRLEMDFSLDARGGVYHSGFAFALPGITADQIDLTGTTLTIGSGAAQTIAPLFSGGANATFEIFKDAYSYTPSNSCSNYYNTSPGCATQPSTTFKLVVKLKTPVKNFPASPYDPFVFRTSTADEKLVTATGSSATGIAAGVEIHLPGQQPTQRALNLFGTKADKSVCTNIGTASVSCSHAYLDVKNQPWALNIPQVWIYPQEFADVVAAYSNIVNWAQSGGSSNTNWYVTPTDTSKTYTGK